MADINTVTQQVTDLQTQATALGTAITDAKTALEAEIARVEALIAAGGATSPAQLQVLADGLSAVASTLTQGATDAASVKSEADAERP